MAAEETPTVVPQIQLTSPFDDVDDPASYPSATELKQLLVPVPEQRGEIRPSSLQWPDGRQYPIRQVYGLFQWNVPWPAGSALRLSFERLEASQIYVWNGNRGVVLRYYPEFQQVWVAYAATRERARPRQDSLVLLGTSGDLYRRSGLGTFDLHARDGRLVMVRGDLTLLDVPFEGPATEVFFEGTGLVRNAGVVVPKWTPEAVAARPSLFKSEALGELAWEKKMPDPKEAGKVDFRKLPDGRVQFSTSEKTWECQATFPYAGPGIGEYTFQVEDPSPGTGVCLTNEKGEHLVRVGFMRQKESGRLMFDVLPVWANEMERSVDANRQPIPWVAPRQWYRLVCGAGQAKVFTSPDGVAWSPIAPQAMGFEGSFARIGLYCIAGDTARSIKLRSVEVRGLEAFASLAPEAVQKKMDLAIVKSENLADWEGKVKKSRPEDVEPAAWWRACALRTLGENPKQQLARPILDRLVQDVLEGDAKPEFLLRFMEETALLYGPDWDTMDRLMVHIERLAGALAAREVATPFTVHSHALLRWPLWHVRRVPVFSDSLLRHEIVALATTDRWDELRQSCRRMRFFNAGLRNGDQPTWSPHAEYVVRWAEGLANEFSPKREKAPAALRAADVRPLVENVSKEGFNAMAEFRAAVDSQAYRETCQMIMTMTGGEKLGPLPHGKDRWLSVSFPVAVEAAMRESPGLRKAMQDSYGKIARLRFNQAAATGDATVMAAMAGQFVGMDVAGEARRWLGDRSLSAGEFGAAARHYRRASDDAVEAEREALAARVRLAGALVGRDAGRPVQGPVQFGQNRYTAAQFEQMIEQLRKAREGMAGTEGTPSLASGFAPGRYELRPWAKIEGRDVRRPPNLPDRGRDWAGRLTGILIAGKQKQMFVNNRLELVAFTLDNGQEQWVQRSSADAHRQRWPLVAMTPVLNEGRLFVRRLTTEGPELACLDPADGTVVWNTRPDSGAISDPMLIDQRLYVLSASYETSKVYVYLVALQPATGHARSRILLAEFRDAWRQQLPCQATAIEDRIVTSVGGCVLCCDTSGQILWMRHQAWIPPLTMEDHDTRPWLDQVHTPPLARDGRVYVTQPGVFGIDCLDLDSGRAIWRQAVGGLTGMIGVASGAVVVQSNDALLALDASIGKPLWRRDTQDCLTARICSGPDSVLVARTMPKKQQGDPARIVFTWLDAKNGQRIGGAAVTAKTSPELWLRPLPAGGGRQWALMATYQEPAKRELLEAIRLGDFSKDETGEDLGK
jgi:outer membrane protein assembly factor BamB